jgi:hypothetical protein
MAFFTIMFSRFLSACTQWQFACFRTSDATAHAADRGNPDFHHLYPCLERTRAFVSSGNACVHLRLKRGLQGDDHLSLDQPEAFSPPPFLKMAVRYQAEFCFAWTASAISQWRM